ncbi:MAG: 2-polyprenylphenol 6-hydroxylase [Candidatus Marinimicrobia bacterium]|nr:2-polyprenylphenol 6-hydroxylase [Candidatus Neomarinimicrobiota bacterium]
MLKKIFNLFKIIRKLSISGAVDVLDEIKPMPKIFKLIFHIFSFGSNNKIESINKTSGEKLCEALQSMGTTFIKLGQFLATRPDIIGDEIAKKLERLQDKLPAFSTNEAKEIIKNEIGIKSFNNIILLEDSVAAASIAQVHFAKIKIDDSEKELAIKILRPNIHQTVNEELDAMMFLAYLIENVFKKTKRLKLVEVIHLLKEITNVEMDLRFEAAAASELHENMRKDNSIKVPKIYWNYTSKKILTLDKVDAIPIREIDNLKTSGIDLKKVSTNLIQLFLKQAVRDGFFHADMHQGNLFVDREGNIIPIDFGIMGRLDKNNKKYLAEILYGFIQRDYVKVAQVHFLAGLVPKNTSKDDFAQALRSIGEPIFGQSVKNISGGNLLAQLFDITEKFNMQTQTQLLLLQKTMVSVEGVARKLNPEANIWDISKPILEDWIKSEKGPEGKIKKTIELSKEVLEKIPDLPNIMDKANIALQMLAEGKLNLYTNGSNNLQIEELKMKNMRNNMIIMFLGIVIGLFIVF